MAPSLAKATGSLWLRPSSKPTKPNHPLPWLKEVEVVAGDEVVLEEVGETEDEGGHGAEVGVVPWEEGDRTTVLIPMVVAEEDMGDNRAATEVIRVVDMTGRGVVAMEGLAATKEGMEAAVLREEGTVGNKISIRGVIPTAKAKEQHHAGISVLAVATEGAGEAATIIGLTDFKKYGKSPVQMFAYGPQRAYTHCGLTNSEEVYA